MSEECTFDTAEEVYEAADILKTGRWYIAEIDNPSLAVQEKTEHHARKALAEKWANSNKEYDASDIRLGETDPDPEYERLRDEARRARELYHDFERFLEKF